MKKKFVDEYHWIDEQEMLDLVAIAQSSPGAIAVNGAIVVGYKLAGMAGVLTAVIATVLPPFTILTLISFCYAAFRSNLFVGWMLNGMQAGVGAVIAQVVWEMGSGIVKDRQWISVLIMAAAFIANYVYNVNVVLIILLCAAIGVVRTLSSGHNKKGRKEARYDLLPAIFKLSSDWRIQFRRRICRHASDPEPGGHPSRLAEPG